MNVIQSLKVSNVRSHTVGEFAFDKDMNAIVGPNGSGKTTLLETLYVLLRGASFKGSIADIAQYGTNQFRAEILLQTNKTTHIRALGFQQIEHVNQKKWMIDNKAYARLPISARLPVVLFEPDLARLISGGPQRRRDYIDHIAGQLDIEVAVAQNRYERTLKQRNQLLKQLREHPSGSAKSDLFVWNTQLAHQAETVVKARGSLLQIIQNEISQFYRQLGGVDDVVLTYQSNVSERTEEYASRFLQFLESGTARDIALGYTGLGPHRDDIQILLADQPAADRASRGETRTIVVALKLLETELLSRFYAPQEIRPTLLLDDVLSELDLIHQERVLEGLKHHQVFLTTTDAHALSANVHTIFLE